MKTLNPSTRAHKQLRSRLPSLSSDGQACLGVNGRAGDHLHVFLVARELEGKFLQQDAQRDRRFHHGEDIAGAPALPATEWDVRVVRGDFVRV